MELETKKLILRQWKKEDFKAFQKLNSDSIVMEYFPSVLNRQESDKLAQEIHDLIESKGWGTWAVEEKESGDFIGYVGLHETSCDLPFEPCIEISWRLLKEYWGKGYATEAGKKVLHFAFEELKLKNVVSFTALVNHRSEATMKRLGMKNLNENFEHPSLPVGHRLSEHVLYQISREDFIKDEP
jgi:ribosomal-protein-alanine N-acetyltransferase